MVTSTKLKILLLLRPGEGKIKDLDCLTVRVLGSSIHASFPLTGVSLPPQRSSAPSTPVISPTPATRSRRWLHPRPPTLPWARSRRTSRSRASSLKREYERLGDGEATQAYLYHYHAGTSANNPIKRTWHTHRSLLLISCAFYPLKTSTISLVSLVHAAAQPCRCSLALAVCLGCEVAVFDNQVGRLLRLSVEPVLENGNGTVGVPLLGV